VAYKPEALASEPGELATLNRKLSELLQKGIKPYDAFEAMVANYWRSLEVHYFEQEFSLKSKRSPWLTSTQPLGLRI